jgi:hypothetical protein
MSNSIRANEWVWVIVQDPEANEKMLGLVDDENDISFIPAFRTKEEAGYGFLHVQREKGKKYEPQAIIFEDLCRYAEDNEFMIFILNGEGEVEDKIKP